MKSVFECDDAGAPGMRTCNLYCVLDCFGAAVYKQSLLRKLPRRNLIHPFGKPYIFLIRRHLHAGVKKTIGLILYRGDHWLATMADVQASDAACKIQITVAVHIFKPGIFSLRHIDWCADRKP